MADSRRKAYRRGIASEHAAAWLLRLKGYRITAMRHRSAAGEIDLIARRRGHFAFVEVKARTKAVDLATAIDASRLRRVAAAAEILLPKYGKECENMQIDVIMVAPWRWPNHVPNVWHG